MQLLISYRRNDSSYVTDRIYTFLLRYFEKGNVFRDIDSIHGGTDFREAIKAAVEKSNAVLAVIGARWLSVHNPDGTRRIDDPGDYVRIELESAIERDTPIIPLLIEGIRPSDLQDLPGKLQHLTFKQALLIRGDPDFESDMERVITALEQHGLSRAKVDPDVTVDFGELGM